MDFNEYNKLLLTSHPDYTVKLWDSRANDIKPTTFKSHKGWVRDVKWSNEENSYQFVSAGDDNQIKIYDIRSIIPLHTITHNTDKSERLQPYKVLSLGWKYDEKSNFIFSGSTDCTLKKHSFK
jgi:WD40 repeat protein